MTDNIHTNDLIEIVEKWQTHPAPVNAALVLKVAERWVKKQNDLTSPPDNRTHASRPLSGKWRYNNGYLCCGTLRIFRADFDTNPSQEFIDELTGWMVAILNRGQAPTPPRGSGIPREENSFDSLPPIGQPQLQCRICLRPTEPGDGFYQCHPCGRLWPHNQQGGAS